jgi:glutathione S-transferase
MAHLQLVIGDKAYSSWSMRPWVLLTELGIPFEEVQVYFDEVGDHITVRDIEKWSPTGKVPSLWLNHAGGTRENVWDSLAIMETAHELHPNKGVWPSDAAARRRARAISAEMHSGFTALRGNMVCNVVKRFPGKGMNPAVQKDIDRISEIWAECRATYGAGGPFLFGRYCAADAMYAPVATRFHTYDVALQGIALEYQQAVLQSASMVKWVEAAKREYRFLKNEEPYAY